MKRRRTVVASTKTDEMKSITYSTPVVHTLVRKCFEVFNG